MLSFFTEGELPGDVDVPFIQRDYTVKFPSAAPPPVFGIYRLLLSWNRPVMFSTQSVSPEVASNNITDDVVP